MTGHESPPGLLGQARIPVRTISRQTAFIVAVYKDERPRKAGLRTGRGVDEGKGRALTRRDRVNRTGDVTDGDET